LEKGNPIRKEVGYFPRRGVEKEKGGKAELQKSKAEKEGLSARNKTKKCRPKEEKGRVYPYQ